MKKLDFLIIGAQKSGTTTLFKLLSEHPYIYMPPQKELPFFTDDHAYASGFNMFLENHYKAVPITSQWGKATPHYLSDDRAASRIATLMPEVKLIVILRDPADRALSHYRMSVRRGIEQRSFEEAIQQQLQPESLEESRKLPVGRASETNTYIVWGEYGRLLKPYFDQFGKQKILTLFTKDLECDPENTLDMVCSFLGLDTVRPASLGKRFHEGGAHERLPWARSLARVHWIRYIWHAVPKRWRSPATYWFHQYNVVKEKDSLSNYDEFLGKDLYRHFHGDAALLKELLGRDLPWENKLG